MGLNTNKCDEMKNEIKLKLLCLAALTFASRSTVTARRPCVTELDISKRTDSTDLDCMH